MKKILFSILTIALVAGGAIGASRAWFSDTEVSRGNTFTTGTIDIAVDDQNPWNSDHSYLLEDMKPSQTDYANFVINNVGSNPVNVWKKVAIDPNSQVTTMVTEPECEAETGLWVNGVCEGNTPIDNIEAVINYDLSVKVYGPESGLTPLWFQTIWEDSDGHTLAQVSNSEGNGDLLGMIPAGGRMEITQSYHMQSDAGNQYQSDSIFFDIVLYAEQLTNTVTLVSKSGADWDNIDQTEVLSKNATLKYKVKDFDFKYDFSAIGLTASTQYVLVSGTNPYTLGVALGSFTTDGSGVINVVNQAIDISQDLTNAKLWLIPASDWNTDHMVAWNGDNYLFETALIEYFDTDL